MRKREGEGERNTDIVKIFLNTVYSHFILMIVKILCSLLSEKSNENIILSMLIMLPCLGSDYLITIFNTPLSLHMKSDQKVRLY